TAGTGTNPPRLTVAWGGDYADMTVKVTVTAADKLTTEDYYIRLTRGNSAAVAYPPLLAAGQGVREDGSTGYVTLVSDKPAEYFFAVAEAGGQAPEMDASGSGMAVSQFGQITLPITGLSGSGAKDVYVTAKNGGDVGNLVKITLPGAEGEPGDGDDDDDDEPTADWQEALESVLAYLRTRVGSPEFGSVGGEWVVLALARGGYEDVDYYDGYYSRIQALLNGKDSAKLDANKSTENARLIVALTALGVDASAQEVGGSDLLVPLSDMSWVRRQGINGPIWALIALDTAPYLENSGLRQDLVNEILAWEIPGGGWSLTSAANADITAMALQALAPYMAQPLVSEAVARGLAKLSALQQADGGYQNQGQGMSMTGGPESIAQAIVALTALGIDPLDESAGFVKPGGDLISALLRYYLEDGCFNHEVGGNANGMATEQGAYALVAYDRFVSGRNSLYDMRDAVKLVTDNVTPAVTDKTALIAEIARAETLRGSDYTSASWSAMQIALNNAKTVAADVNTTQAAVDNAASLLASAISNLRAPDPAAQQKHVWISVTDHGATGGQASVYFSLAELEMNDNETAFSILQRTGLDIRTATYNQYAGVYVEAINGFGEFSDGPLSGWMYSVNGVFPDYSASLYTLEDGDIVAWVYTRDLGKDVGGGFLGEGEDEQTNTGTPATGGGGAAGSSDGGGIVTIADATTPLSAFPGLVDILDGDTPLSGFVNWESPFADVKQGDWFCDAVAFAQTYGLMVGTADHAFSPNANLTRGMIVTMLWRMEEAPSVEFDAFTDVPADQWYAGAVAWAAANGLVAGYGGGLFGPDNDITREQLAAILMNYASYKGLAIAEGSYITAAYAKTYADAGAVSSWAQGAMKWANGLGLINGRTDTTLAPLGTATRAETAAILQRFVIQLTEAKAGAGEAQS
ncbi:MAG: S-layer homology domain-containing protein, partial [Clostridiales bacterium]|nr:S-layer homology domain-containing protein [Clostridiales bacterium]